MKPIGMASCSGSRPVCVITYATLVRTSRGRRRRPVAPLLEPVDPTGVPEPPRIGSPGEGNSDSMVPEGIADVAPWRDWATAAEGVLRFLHEHVGWDVWLVTRVEDDDQVVLAARPEGAVRPGTRLPWTES